MKWNIGQFVGKVGKKTKEKRGTEDEVQTFVNYILKNRKHILHIQSARRWGQRHVNVCDHWHVRVQQHAWASLAWPWCDSWPVTTSNVSQLLSTKRKLGHQKQHGAHSSTSRSFTNPLSLHSHTICPAYSIFKYSYNRDILFTAYATIKITSEANERQSKTGFQLCWRLYLIILTLT